MKERMRLLMGAQSKLESGRHGSLPRREYFDDAADLFAIECAARGVPEPDWLEERVSLPSSRGRPRRRRRRRRRR